VANAGALVMNLTANGLLFVMTRYLQSVLGHDALAAGLMMVPMFVPLVVLAPVAGRLTARHGPRPALVAGAALAAAGMAALLLAAPARGYWGVFPGLIAFGLGIGTFATPVVAAAIRAVPPERSGLASGINNTARQVGTALGVAIYGAFAGPPARRRTWRTTSPRCTSSAPPPRPRGWPSSSRSWSPGRRRGDSVIFCSGLLS